MTPLAEILSEITRFAEGHKGAQVWLAARNLKTGARFGVGENERVRTASTIKLPILVAAYQGAAEGRWKLDDPLTIRAQDKVSGSGVIREFADGTRLTLRDTLHVMIVVSDNTATNMVIERITADYVNEVMDRYKLPGTRSMRKVRGDGTNLKAAEGFSAAGRMKENERFGLGSSTSAEMVRLLELLERGEAVNPAASKEMLAILDRQQYKDGIGRHMDRVVSKSGSLDALRSDVGIVYGEGGPVAMALTVDGMAKVDYSPDNAGNLLISRLAKLLVEGLQPSRA